MQIIFRRTFYLKRRKTRVTPVDPHLEKLQREVATAVGRFTSSTVAGEELTRHSPGKWSAAEIFEHLYLTYTGTMKGFERVLEAGKPKVTAPTLKQRVGKFVVIGFSHMPSGREAPKTARPRGLPTEKVLAEIVPKIAEMDAFLSRCEETLGRGKVLDHPILGPLTVAEWKKFHMVHGLHHLRQIRNLRKSANHSG
jgi:hypothetical protein